MKKKRKREYRASALVVSLLVLAAILVTAMSVSLVSIKERSISSNASKSSQAFQNADAGVESVMYEITKGGHTKVSQINNCQSSGKIEKDNYKVQLMDSNGIEIDCNANKNISDVDTIKSVGTDDSGRTQRAISATVPTASFSCGGTISGSNGDTNTYGTVLAEDGNCWLDRNLGATQVATAYNDSNAYGWLYQWGRLTDGHQISTSGTTDILSSTNVPGHSNFIVNEEGTYDWRSPQNDNLWQGVNGINNPCPNGFRLPTKDEWITLFFDAGITNSATAFSSSLKLPVAGNRNDIGTFHSQGSYGFYWSSSPSSPTAYTLFFNSTNAHPADDYFRVAGFSVRCIRN